ncbi:MAG TPA: DUF3011 domain-containing protein [Bdellovibrionota bacterium]|jgi:hypothetical protein
MFRLTPLLSIMAMVGLNALSAPLAQAEDEIQISAPGYHQPPPPGWGPPHDPYPPPPPYYSEYVTCRSIGGPFYTQCFVRGYVRRARIVRQYSNAPCRLGDSWGYERDSVWVGRGCSGVFEVQLY